MLCRHVRRPFEVLEKYFTVCFTIAVLLGLFLPRYTHILDERLVIYAMMIVLFLSFLKIDLAEVLGHARRPALLAYALAMHLIVLPALAYLAMLPFERQMQVGIVLLVAMPTGVAAAAIAGMVGGRTSLTLLLCTLSSLLAPLSVPGMLYVLFGARIELSYGGLLLLLLLMIAVPLGAAQLAKRFATRAARALIPYGGGVSVILLCLVITSVIAAEEALIRQNVDAVLRILIVLYAAFVLLQLAGYLMGFWLAKEERVALSVAKAVMNNALGLVVAISFFAGMPQVALICALSELPWSTVPVLYRLYQRYLP